MSRSQLVNAFEFGSRMLLMVSLSIGGMCAPAISQVQPGASHQGAIEQTRLLEVRRQQVELKAERAALERIQRLFDEKLVSRVELEEAEVGLARAQLNYQNAVLEMVYLEPRLVIKQATKMETKDRRKIVRLVLENRTPTFDDAQFELLNNFEGADPIPDELRTRDVRDVFVSIKQLDGSGGGFGNSILTNIGLPYEFHIDRLAYGEVRGVEFQLLRDVSEAVIVVGAAAGERQYGVQLKQATTEQVAALRAAQTSQEADLGAQAVFNLRLSRSSIDQRSLQLQVMNLPQQIDYAFIDPASQARLSRISFQAGEGEKDLQLKLYLPEQPDQSMVLDQPIEFWAVAATGEEEFARSEQGLVTAKAIEDSRVARVALELVPRGVGKLEVSAPSLFSEIRPGEELRAFLTVRNTGTRRLDNVRLTSDEPLAWSTKLTPDVISSLEVGEESRVNLEIVPVADVAAGEYEVRVKTQSSAYNRPVQAEDKIYRVSVKAGTRVWAMVGLVGVFFLVTTSVVAMGVRFARR